jgi:uncharacterized membrane protein YfcA
VGFDFIARTFVTHESLSVAASKSFQWLTEPLAAVLLLLPFIAAAVLGAELANAADRRVGTSFFGALLAVLALLYFSGFWNAQAALLERKWTAASLSVALTPFLSIPVLFIAGIAAVVIARRHRKRET